MSGYTDIRYDKNEGVARITICREERLNAFTNHTADELIRAVTDASWDASVGVIVLAGAGEKAFCTGGDQSAKEGQKATGRGTTGMPTGELYSVFRDAPKPVIARVQGFAIGGGNVLATVCDLTIASDRAIFGQVGPKVGSVDPGWGTALLSHLVGEKRAREMWYLCRRYDASAALRMGLCNIVVPHKSLDAEVDQWCAQILSLSPTALAIAKRSFNVPTESIRALGDLGREALALYYQSAESKEGMRAFLEKRRPNFRGA
jgi:2-ketocyclohexanecarboxyl-CoA hydrolase